MAKELATTDDQLPAYLANVDVGPQDNFDSSDVTLPRIKLLQGISPEVTDFDEAKSGCFWHTGADANLGDNMRFVIISRRKKYLLAAPLDDGQGILARSDDAKTWDRKGSWQVKVDKKTTATWTIDTLDVAKSGLTDWGTFDPEDPKSPPAATLVYEYLVLLPDNPELGPVVISLSRSAIRKAKKGLNDKIDFQRGFGRPLQSLVFSAKSVQEQSPAGAYNNWAFTSSGFASEDIYNMAKELSVTMSDYKVANEGVDEETAAPADGETSF